MQKTGCLTGILTVCLVLLLTTVLLVAAIRNTFGDSVRKMSKEEAQADVSTFFEKNLDSLNRAADAVREQSSEAGVSVKGVSEIGYSAESGADRVTFTLGSCGMLGGQEWGFFRTADAMDDVKEWHEPGGNNYSYTEKLTEGWYFYFIDYDHS